MGASDGDFEAILTEVGGATPPALDYPSGFYRAMPLARDFPSRFDRATNLAHDFALQIHVHKARVNVGLKPSMFSLANLRKRGR